MVQAAGRVLGAESGNGKVGEADGGRCSETGAQVGEEMYFVLQRGTQLAMEYLEQIMSKRAGLVRQ